MHQCLRIAELFDIICKRVLATGHQSSLAALCRTCRLFHEPALNVLYNSLESLRPLLFCIPAIVRIGKRITTFKELRLSDWQRMQFYAKRVHSLRVNDQEEFVIDKTILHALATSPFAPPMFTHLKRLWWSNNSADALPLLCSLVNARLEWLILHDLDSRLLPRVIPHITSGSNSLHVVCFPAKYSMRDIHPDMFQSWRNLQSLVCGLVDDTMLYHLATYSKLTHLTIQVDEKNDYSSLMKLAGQPVFPALQGLDITATHTLHCVHILEIAELPSLRSLRIHSTEEGLTNAEVHQCFRLISRQCPSLRDLRIKELQISPPEFPIGYIITFDTLKTLFLLRHLEALHLDTTCTFALDDKELAQLADMWLKLRALELGIENGWRQPSKITLQGFAELLRRCPVLSVVGFAMNAWAPDIDDRRPGCGVRRNGLEVLRVADSKITDPLSVAAFLSDVVPNAEITGYDIEYDMTGTFNTRMMYRERWEEVSMLHPLLVNLRRQEAVGWGSNERSRDREY
ncbi:hypothetical protein DEU56DRAFT_49625 [Suillus clintonianus]|uniref:uncharacterized protein n=1 Tax=Suillus clintonianus TaxID=1904413 RepID=UPI001B85D05E|nr:uncharacterized protein DEU56DRAFT_49625 [Suillus clintonianus]KAG2123479.1 hypothetical protein DEU56DRAFT_49625 [Suillus clintonianus]